MLPASGGAATSGVDHASAAAAAPVPPFGVGFRRPHFDEILAAPGAVDWLEIVSDNFLDAGGTRRARLERLRASYPLAMHGVGLSIAGSDPLSAGYLRSLRALAARIEPVWVSDHLCWTSLAGRQSHDLLPVAYTEEVLAHVATRVARVQDVLGRRLLLENPSAYVAFRDADMSEAAFLAALARRTGCGILLDVNNLYVNARNLGIDPDRYLATLPAGAVGYLHLAGHAVLADVRIDTHDAAVPPPVWDLFAAAVRRFPEAGVIVERDDRLPPFACLAREVDEARARHAAARAAATAVPCRGGEEMDGRRAAARAPAPALARWSTLQRALWDRLVDKPCGYDHGPEGALARLLDGGRPVAAARGLRVYSDAYEATLRRALATHFPALARVLDAGDFAALAAAYLRRHPPRGHDFRALGAGLASFIRTYPLAADHGVPSAVLAELAALEQAQLEVQEAGGEPDAEAGSATITPAALARLTPAEWERARFTFVRALRLVVATHDVLAVVEAVGRGALPARPAPAGVVYLVRRAGDGLRSERLTPSQAWLLAALRAGRSLAAACRAASARDRATGARVVEESVRLLLHAARWGLIARIDVRGSRPRGCRRWRHAPAHGVAPRAADTGAGAPASHG